MKTTLSLVAAMVLAAPMAFAGGCNSGAHYATNTAESDTMTTPTVVATVDCTSLTGDALAACIAAKAQASN